MVGRMGMGKGMGRRYVLIALTKQTGQQRECKEGWLGRTSTRLSYVYHIPTPQISLHTHKPSTEAHNRWEAYRSEHMTYTTSHTLESYHIGKGERREIGTHKCQDTPRPSSYPPPPVLWRLSRRTWSLGRCLLLPARSIFSTW